MASHSITEHECREYENHNQLSDNEFLYCFETLTLDQLLFTHDAHVRLAWLYLKKENSFEKALEKITEGIKRFDNHFAGGNKYHHTITVAFAFIINNRFRQCRTESWEKFMLLNKDLKVSRKALLVYYSDSLLDSPEAKIKFIEPDLLTF